MVGMRGLILLLVGTAACFDAGSPPSRSIVRSAVSDGGIGVRELTAPPTGITVAPAIIPAQVATDVTFTCKASVYAARPPSTVTLEQRTSTGSFRKAATLKDDGSGGDAVAGDGTFSGRHTLTLATRGQRAEYRIVMKVDRTTVTTPVFAVEAYQITANDSQVARSSLMQASQHVHELAETGDVPGAAAQVVGELIANPAVVEAFVGHGGQTIEVRFDSGIAAEILLFDPNAASAAVEPAAAPSASARLQPTEPSGELASAPSEPVAGDASATAVGDPALCDPVYAPRINNNKVLLLAPFVGTPDPIMSFDATDDLLAIFGPHRCPGYDVTRLYGEQATPKAFAQLAGAYGIVFVQTHGSPSLMATGTETTPAWDVIYASELTIRSLRYSVSTWKTPVGTVTKILYGVTPEYIRANYRPAANQNPLVFSVACATARGDAFARAYNDLGAKMYFGFSDVASIQYGTEIAIDFFSRFLSSKSATIASAYTAGFDPYFQPAWMSAYGAVGAALLRAIPAGPDSAGLAQPDGGPCCCPRPCYAIHVDHTGSDMGDADIYNQVWVPTEGSCGWELEFAHERIEHCADNEAEMQGILDGGGSPRYEYTGYPPRGCERECTADGEGLSAFAEKVYQGPDYAGCTGIDSPSFNGTQPHWGGSCLCTPPAWLSSCLPGKPPGY